jgi:hypothetical protein
LGFEALLFNSLLLNALSLHSVLFVPLLINPLTVEALLFYALLCDALLFDALLLDTLLFDTLLFDTLLLSALLFRALLISMLLIGPLLTRVTVVVCSLLRSWLRVLVLTAVLVIAAALGLCCGRDEDQAGCDREHTKLFHTSPLPRNFYILQYTPRWRVCRERRNNRWCNDSLPTAMCCAKTMQLDANSECSITGRWS